MTVSKQRLTEIEKELNHRISQIYKTSDDFMNNTVGGSQMRFEMSLDTVNWLTDLEFHDDTVDMLVTAKYEELYEKLYDETWYDRPTPLEEFLDNEENQS